MKQNDLMTEFSGLELCILITKMNSGFHSKLGIINSCDSSEYSC